MQEWQEEYEKPPTTRMTAMQLYNSESTKLRFYLYKVEASLERMGKVLTVNDDKRDEFYEAVIIRFMNNRDATAGIYLNDDEISNIVSLRLEGYTLSKIVELTNRSETSIRKVLRANGFPKLHCPYKDEEIKLIKRMTDEGYTDTEIGDSIGRSRGALQAWRTRTRNLKQNPPTIFDDNELESLRQLVRQGYSPSQIQEEEFPEKDIGAIHQKLKSEGLTKIAALQWENEEIKLFLKQFDATVSSKNSTLEQDKRIAMLLDRPTWQISKLRLSSVLRENLSWMSSVGLPSELLFTQWELDTILSDNRHPRLSQEDRDLFIQYLIASANLTYDEVSSIFRVSRGSIQNSMRRLETGKGNEKDARPFNQEQVDHIIGLFNDGISVNEIAQEMQVSRGKVSRCLQKNGRIES